MKRLFVLLALIAIVFASCKKYETSEELDLNTLPKVAITGTVYADLDERLDGLELVTPDLVEVKVLVRVPYSDYFSNNPGGYWLSEVKVDEHGKFSVEVPVVSKGVNATVTFTDFTYDVPKKNALGQEYKTSKHFTFSSKTVQGLGSNGAGHIIPNIQYQDASSVAPNDNVLTPDKEVIVTGKLNYIFTNGADSARDIPDGTMITATITLTGVPNTKTYNEIQQIRVSYGGMYTLKVPMVEGGRASVRLTGEGFWEYTIVATTNTSEKRAYYRYELDRTITVYNFPSTVSKQDFTYRQDVKIMDN